MPVPYGRKGDPMYAFVHGNLALANSAGGKYCGVDNEMAILRDTGCYADFTLPSAPDETQVAVINQIYEYGGDPDSGRPALTWPAGCGKWKYTSIATNIYRAADV